MKIKEIIKGFLQGEISFDDFMFDYFENVIIYFEDKIYEFKFIKFLPYYVECYLYFANVYRTDPSYNFHFKQLLLKFKKMKNINSFFQHSLNNINSKIVKMDLVYKHILTLYYVFFEEIPNELCYIFYMHNLIVDSTLDKICGGNVDDFILKNILELTDAKIEYKEKIDFIENMVSKYFIYNQSLKYDFDYELKGIWPMEEDNSPLKYVSNKDNIFIFIDSKGKLISLGKEELSMI